MCDPVSATALLLSAGGTYLESREATKNQNRMTDAKNAAYQTGMIEQRKFQDEAGAAFNHNVQKQGREQFDQEAANEGDRIRQAFSEIRTQPEYNNTGMAASTPKNVVIAQKAANDKVDAETTRDLNNQATLAGYGGALFNQGMNQNQFARLFGNTQNAAQGKMQLLPLEMSAAANNASKSPSLFPTLMKGAGMAMGMYGAANGITSFGDKMVQGPLPLNGIGPGAPISQPGLFTKIKSIPGNFY